MKAAVVITTKNRLTDLRRALASTMAQSVDLDAIVVDDGSSDGTSDMVRADFPSVRVFREAHSQGCIRQRNYAATLTAADIIFSIDDDAQFSSPHVVAKTLALFEHSRVAAVAIPYAEPHKSHQILQLAPDGEKLWIADYFRGTAYAVRRNVFVRLGGFREGLVHQGEELDFCIRLLAHGYVVRLGHGDHIDHFETPRRDWSRMDYFGRRNDILFVWHNVPNPFFGPHLIATTFNGLRWAAAGRNMTMVRGLVSGYRDLLRSWRMRAPVSAGTYRLHRILKKRGPRLLSEIEPLLPPIKSL